MDVTVLGTTGCGSPELANIHRDNSRIRFSAYYDPCRDMIDPCRTTKFHAHFKPFTVVHAKYQPGQHPPVRQTRSRNSSTQIKQIHHVPISTKLSKDSSSLSKSTCSSSSNLSAGFVDDLLSELIATELRDVITECQEETESEIVVDSLIDKILDDVVDSAMVKVSKGLVDNVITSALDTVMQPTPSSADQKTVRIMSNFSCLSDSSPEWSESYSTGSSLEVADLVEDVVRKIMKCFDGDHRQVYPGQTSTTDCRTKDGEEIITDIITRLVGTVQNFTRCTGTVTPITESTESLLSSGQPSRESLKDLHKRAQFLLNHALDIARVKLKLSGYSYLTWNIMEDCLQKGRDKLLFEKPDTIAQLSDVEIVEWIMEEAKKFLQDATTLMYDMMHGEGDDEVAKIESVERRYLEQLEKSDQAFNPEMIDEAMLEEVAAEGDVAKFAVLLVKKTLHEAATSIPRRSSVMLSEALRDGNFDLAGSIMAAKAITVAHKELELDPQKPAKMQLKKALRDGDVSTAGTLLAHRAIQQAMNININEPEFAEKSISTMILEVALDQGDLETAGKVVIGSSLREALKYINTPTPDISLDQALKYGDLEIAGTIIADIALEQGLQQIHEEDCQLRRESSIALENALCTGDVPAAGEILTSRLLRSGMSELESEVDDKLVDKILNSPSKMGDLEKVISNKSSVILRGALAAGDFEAAAPILINRAFRVVNEEDKKEQNENVIPMNSSEVLQGALKSGDLETAAPVLANRAIRSAQGGNLEKKTLDDTVIPMSSSEILRGALITGDLDAAAPVLANRALRSAMSGEGDGPENEPELSKNGENVVTISSSERILQDALETGNLDDAAPVLANRALKSAMSGEDDNAVQNADWSSDSVEKSISSASTGVCSTQDIQNQRSEEIVVPVNSYEELKIVKTSSCLGEEIEPSFVEGIYYLEAFKKTNIDEKTYERGEAFVQSILNDLTSKFEVIFGDDIKNDCGMLKPSLIKSDYNGAGNVLVKSLLDNIRLTTLPIIEAAMDRTKFASFLSRLVFQKCLETIRGGPGSDMTRICEHINDHIRKTLSVINVTAGSDAIISMVIGKCLKLVTGNAGKDVRGRSSIELFEACMAGDAMVAGGILTQKVLKKAEEDAVQVDVSTFKSTDEILSEKHVSDGSTKLSASSTSIRSTKRKKKINTERLPMPKPLSFTKSRSNTAVSSKSDYEPIRKLLMSEEREFMVNQIVSQSERSIENQRAQSAKSLVAKSSKNLSRKESIAASIEQLADFCDQKLKERPLDVGDRLTVNSSDESLPLRSDDSFSNESLGYVRKIQSKGYIYYINEDGVIKKRARRKRTSKKRLSQDDLNGISELDSKDRDQEDSLEPKAVSSETSLLKSSLSSDLPPISSKKSMDHRRSTIKKKDSSLQVLAVINSSYTNMLGRKTSGEAVENRESEVQATSSDTKTKPSIDEMLSETDKELIKKLSCASVEEKQADS